MIKLFAAPHSAASQAASSDTACFLRQIVPSWLFLPGDHVQVQERIPAKGRGFVV